MVEPSVTRILSVCVPVVPVEVMPVLVVVDVVTVVDMGDVVGVGEVTLAPAEAEPLAELLVATAEDAREGKVTMDEVAPKTEPSSESVCIQCDSFTVIVGLTASVITGHS